MSLDEWFAPRRSPDGVVEVRFEAIEMRMSHWVQEPIVVRTRDGREVLSLSGTLWDAAGPTAFPRPGVVELTLRHYPDGAHEVVLVVDVETETFGIGRDAAADQPVARLRDALPKALKQARAAARGAGRGQAGDHS
ncbi:MAG TPA: hypothetical protein VFQ85_02735 [Mycobacteriales bacterium]|jgi:hypothetical protein|nr:hypothetical protein [Mycobacteriales bacterium]